MLNNQPVEISAQWRVYFLKKTVKTQRQFHMRAVFKRVLTYSKTVMSLDKIFSNAYFFRFLQNDSMSDEITSQGV